jgi:hypothetical protein
VWKGHFPQLTLSKDTERTLALSFSGGKIFVIVRACEGRDVFSRLVDISEI